MRISVFLFAVLGASLTFAAQIPAQVPQVAKAANNPVVVRWAEGAPGASSTVQNGMRIESLRSGNVLLKISPLNNFGQHLTQTWVGILNSGPDAVKFDADNASVVVIKPKAKNITAIPAGTAAKAIKNSGESAAQVLASSGQQGNLNCTPAQIMGGCQPPGSGASTQAAQDRELMSTQQSQWASQNGLRTSNLEAGSSLQGAVFFPREKEKEYVVRIPVGNYIFEFPFGGR